MLCATRRAHPSWGPKKLLQYLALRQRRITEWPAVSTVGDLLVRHGLVTKRRRRRRSVHPGTVPPHTTEPNDLWAADFKGQFRTGDGIDCYPLTVSDQHSRYLLTCHSLRNVQTVGARPVLERAFQEYGLPLAIRTDHGVPFATCAIHGLSELNVWWMRLGIRHQRIHPGRPQQNGAYERMHQTLKAEAIRPPRATMAAGLSKAVAAD
jgi:transposase InsO family protein